jgi:pinin
LEENAKREKEELKKERQELFQERKRKQAEIKKIELKMLRIKEVSGFLNSVWYMLHLLFHNVTV